MRRNFLVAAVIVFAGARDASAVNLLVNPGFNTDLSGWTVSNGAGFGTTSWDGTLDANNSLSSGSAKTVAQFATASTTGVFLYQCYETPAPGATYTYGGKMFIPPNQPTTGSGIVLISMFDQPGCGPGNLLGFASQSVTAVGAWTTVSGTMVAPPGTQSIWFSFQTAKTQAGGSFQLSYDDALLDGPPPAIAQIPALGSAGVFVLGLVLAVAALGVLRRRG